MAFSGHPILNEIKTGFKLRPTKTVDKSKPIFLAEGEVADFSAATDKSKNLENVPAPPISVNKSPSPRPSWKDKAETPAAPAPDFPGLGAGGAPPPPPPPPPGGFGGAPPPPPPPPGGFAPPPPPPAPVMKKPLNPKLLKLGGNAAPSDEDRGALLKSIQGGIRLKKTVTNDKSGLVVDEDLKKASVKMVEPTGPPPELLIPKPKPSPTGRGRGQLTPNTLSPKGISSEDERYLTPDEHDLSDYGTPEPEERPRSKWSRTPEPEPPKKIDYAFDEKNLKVTAEALAEEIPKGLAASKIAKWLQAENVDGGATLPKPNFRASPLRMSPFNEVNNNTPMEQLKPKAPSKWAVVETGGLRRPGQGNVPIDRSREATPRATTPRPYRDRTGSNLDAPVFDRARTASPTLEFSSRRRSSTKEDSDEFEIEEELELELEPEPEPKPIVVTKKRPSVTKKTEPEVKTTFKKAEVKKEEPVEEIPKKKEEVVKKETTTKKTGATTGSTKKRTESPLTVKTDLPSPSSASSKLSTPLSIKTDFSSTSSRKSLASSDFATDYTSPRSKPEIKETPPTPSHTKKTNGTAYSYKKTERAASPPPEAQPSPVSSMSSASVPSPSSISPGSTSPDQLPKRARPINPNFDKFKEKFASGDVSNATPSGAKTERPSKIGNVSIKDNPFAKALSSSPKGSISATSDEAEKVKKAVKEAAAKRVINVPISAPWHTPRDGYTSSYSPSFSSRDSYSSRDFFSPSYTSSQTFDYPISARETSWRSTNRDTPTYTRTSTDLPYTSRYATMHPDDLHRNYRFNIDISSDTPLSLSRR